MFDIRMCWNEGLCVGKQAFYFIYRRRLFSCLLGVYACLSDILNSGLGVYRRLWLFKQAVYPSFFKKTPVF